MRKSAFRRSVRRLTLRHLILGMLATFSVGLGIFAAAEPGDPDAPTHGSTFPTTTEPVPACDWSGPTVISGISLPYIWVHAADVDRDGDRDVLGAGWEGDRVCWWENEAGDGSVWTERMIAVDVDGPCSVYGADVDNDRDLDVIGAIWYAGDVLWWENTSGDGTAWTEHVIATNLILAGSVCSGDVDGDGDEDVLGTGCHSFNVIWWENEAGDGSVWTEHVVDGAYMGARSACFADLDQDLDLDVIGAAFEADQITWWENEVGDGSRWAKRIIDRDFDAAIAVTGADVDGDEDIDVVGVAQLADEVTWWENEAGDGTAWTEHVIDGSFDGARAVIVADFDGDRDADVLAGAFDADQVAYWENVSGDGTSWTKRIIDAAFDIACSVDAADVDGDGDMDALGAALAANQIAWWENLATPRTPKTRPKIRYPSPFHGL